MRVAFRQGIVSHPPTFLQFNGSGHIDLLSSSVPVTFTISHYTANYTHKEIDTILDAWKGPFPASCWLYLEFNTRTFQRTFGYSNIAPLYDTAPTLKQEGQYWYNTFNNAQFVYSKGVWQPTIRIYVAKVVNNSFYSLSDREPAFIGTQIGPIGNVDVETGEVVVDVGGTAQRTFITTETLFTPKYSELNSVKLESAVINVRNVDSTALPAFSVVTLVGDKQIRAATYSDIGGGLLMLLLDSVGIGGTGFASVHGIVTNYSWNWATVGAPLWINNIGQLTDTDPHIVDVIHNPTSHVPVGRVMSPTTVLFDQGLGGPGERGPAGSLSNLPPATLTSLGAVMLTASPTESAYPRVVADTDPRMSDNRYPKPHTHYAVEVTTQPTSTVTSNNVQAALAEIDTNKVNKSGDTMSGFLTLHSNPTSNMHAASKLYVDSLVSGLNWVSPVSHVNLISNTLQTPPTTPHVSDCYIVPVGSTGAWSTLINHLVTWDGTVWFDHGLVQNIPTNTRFGVAIETPTNPSGSFAGKETQIAILTDPLMQSWSFEVPQRNAAVYVSNTASMHAYHQYAFNGTAWIEFGGGQAISPRKNLVLVGNNLDVLDYADGGTIDANTIQGHTPSDFALVGHAHTLPTAIQIQSSPTTSTLFGTPISPETVTAVNVQTAINQIVDAKASRTPRYAGLSDLPPAATNVGMVTYVDATDRLYYAGASGWIALAKYSDLTHQLPYDISFSVASLPPTPSTLGSVVVARSMTLPVDLVGSVAVSSTVMATETILDIEVVGSTITTIGTATFAVGTKTATFTTLTPVSTVLSVGDVVRVLSTTNVDTTAVLVNITIVGCATVTSCGT